jgi:hypothetical protein
LTPPGRLAVATVPDIRQAFEKHEPLRELLAKHRYLALARANLADRLTILRQLIAVDPGNATWKHDVEEMERARLADIRNEAAAAVRAGDADGVGKLVAELRNNPWQTPGADELKNTLSQTSAALYQATAFDQLRALVPAVREAMASGSLEQSQQVFAQWGRVVKTAKVIVPPDLRQEILPLALWLDEQEDLREREREFRVACEDLAATVGTNAPVELLTRRYRQALAFEMEIPDALLTSYRRALQIAQRDQRGEKRKQLALGALLVGVIVLALAAAAYVILGNGKI